jgi:aspartyl-tRNA(Asn)/glutamyl-tRNA(Gln) amidotransferase subunit C
MSRLFPEPTAQLSIATERDEIRRVAALARVRLTPAEEESFISHLHTMLSYVEKLREVNTEDVEPLTHAGEACTLMREDRITNQPNTTVLLQNAPAREGDLFVVPRIIE